VKLQTAKNLETVKFMLDLLKDIEMVFFDFDGVFTDNRVLVSSDGKESVFCHRSDGIGLSRIKEVGVASMVISSESDTVVTKRCTKLKIKCIQACENKLQVMTRIITERNLNPKQIAFVGNDLNDLECMMYVGIPIAVADAYPQIKTSAKLVTACKGGYGAVREICDWILDVKQKNG